MPNRQIYLPKTTNDRVQRSVLTQLSTEERAKVLNKQGKVVCIDGEWYFLDMDMNRESNGQES